MRYRLPTEAEWEYAARSGGKREKWAGTNSEEKLREYAWYRKNSGDEPHPVGQKKPNGLGLHDMSGNVLEWVQDWYSSDYYKQPGEDLNPQGPNLGLEKAVRGGSCNLRAENIRLSSRKRFHPRILIRNENIGFRLVHPALPEQTSIAEKEQPPAPGEKPYGTPTPSLFEPLHEPSSKPFQKEVRADGQSVKPTNEGLGVGAKIGLTVMVFLIGGMIYGLLRDIAGHGHYIVLGIMTFIIWYIWSRRGRRK
jgi:hypothetical protein